MQDKEKKLPKEVTMPKEDQKLTAEVQQHVEKNTVKADPTRRICVDGGYRPNENKGALARPGADMGFVEALLHLKELHPEMESVNTVEKCFALVFDFVRSKNWKFAWHTDHHADPTNDEGHHHEKPILGCGHCARAVSSANDYGVKSEDVVKLIDLVRSKHNEAEFDLVNLNREHAEKAVLVVTGTENTVNSWDVDGTGNQFFIYDATRDAEFIREFVEYLVKKGVETSLEEYTAALNRQTDVTLALLAKGKSMYTVDADAQVPAIAFAQTVSDLETVRSKYGIASPDQAA